MEKKGSRVRTCRTPENIGVVRQRVEEAREAEATSRNRQMAAETGMSRNTIWRIVCQDLRLHAYHIKLLHKLNEDDFDRRVEFCEIALDRHEKEKKKLHLELEKEE